MEKKYEFTGETKEYCGVLLNRIIATKDFGYVKKGELGGWVARESNLSHKGDCWVYDEAMVYDNAIVLEDASVYGRSKVFGRSIVKGNAKVGKNSEIKDHTVISGYTRIWGNAKIQGRSEVFGNSLVQGEVRISGKAKVFGRALVTDKAFVSGNTEVYEDAKVDGYARICGEREILTKSVVTISHPLHRVTITDTHITIGCQSHPKSFWKNATYDDILKMNGAESAKYWVEFKPYILKIADVPSKTFTINLPFCNKKLIISG